MMRLLCSGWFISTKIVFRLLQAISVPNISPKPAAVAGGDDKYLQMLQKKQATLKDQAFSCSLDLSYYFLASGRKK